VAVNPLEQLRGRPPKIERTPITARVTKRDSEGIWVVPLGADQRTPVGPCRGSVDLRAGDICLVVWTQELPWALGESTRLDGRVSRLESDL
jgi:hypothetical protein